jgi:hypothetical protein
MILQGQSHAQNLSVGDPFEKYIRFFGDDGQLGNLPSYNLRAINVEAYFESDTFNQIHPWENHHFFQKTNSSDEQGFTLYSPQLKTTFNSHLPVGQNDGALWQGKGINTLFTGGFTASYGIIRASFEPQFTFSQNKDFTLSRFTPANRLSQFAAPLNYSGEIDNPQRYGSRAINTVHPGNSWIRLEYSGVSAGISTENIWSGPATQNPIVFSNNGPGFVHGFFGTYKPVQTPIGSFEWRLLGGRLKESKYFDDFENNNKRFLNGLIINYSPSFIPGLHLGGSRTIQKYDNGNNIKASDFFEVFQPLLKENFESDENPTGDEGTHQLLSLFARWMFPSYGMEVYTEWSRNDHSADYQDLSRHFEHARAYVLGLTKKIELSNRNWLTTNIEVTQLEVPRLEEFRHTGSYYQNGEIVQGFTHKGQVLGAGIGPGSNSQIITVNYFEPKGMWGISLNRIVHNNDRLYQFYQRSFLEREPWDLNTVEFRVGLHGLRFIDTQNFEIQADLYWSRILNYDYEYKNDRNNLNLQLGIRYYLPNAAR